MGQGKSQFTEEELQDYEVNLLTLQIYNLIIVFISGLDVFHQKRGALVSKMKTTTCHYLSM